jgi:predicted nucleic acid-binding protein
VIVLDTTGLVALLDRGERSHIRVRQLIDSEPGPLLVLDLVLAETDHLILHRLGAKAERAFLAQLMEGGLVREPLTHDDLQRVAAIATRFSDHAFGLTDCAVMAVAERLGAKVLTLDRRHFSLFRTRRGKALTLLPDD